MLQAKLSMIILLLDRLDGALMYSTTAMQLYFSLLVIIVSCRPTVLFPFIGYFMNKTNAPYLAHDYVCHTILIT